MEKEMTQEELKVLVLKMAVERKQLKEEIITLEEMKNILIKYYDEKMQEVVDDYGYAGDEIPGYKKILYAEWLHLYGILIGEKND